jgi:Holliday junction resolvase RusA-like endonuclease
MNEVKEQLNKILMERKKRNLTLIIAANNQDGCFDRYLVGQSVCQRCQNQIQLCMDNLATNFKDFKREIETLFGFNGIFRGGKRFFLDIPPKSFRSLSKNPDLLKAYKIIIKEEMEKKNIVKFEGEILLYLCLNLYNKYSQTDCDNMIKPIADALQNVLYTNDSQIKVLICEKHKVGNRLHEKLIVAIKNI